MPVRRETRVLVCRATARWLAVWFWSAGGRSANWATSMTTTTSTAFHWRRRRSLRGVAVCECVCPVHCCRLAKLSAGFFFANICCCCCCCCCCVAAVAKVLVNSSAVEDYWRRLEWQQQRKRRRKLAKYGQLTFCTPEAFCLNSSKPVWTCLNLFQLALVSQIPVGYVAKRKPFATDPLLHHICPSTLAPAIQWWS